MNAPDCPDPRVLSRLLDNEAAGDAPEWTEHLETCARCRQTLADLAAEHSTWEEVARYLPQVEDSLPGPGQPPARAPALERTMAQLKKELLLLEPAADEEELTLSFLRAPDRPGLLGYVGQYEVLEVIGRGGMGVVFKAFDPRLHRMVAIKVLAPQRAASVNARRRFLREGRAAAAISHDHVVSIYEVAETAGLPYLVMQYIAGESLQDRLDRTGPLELTEIVRIGLQTAAALAAAHAQGLIHRDIKPANLLLENGLARVKITDFVFFFFFF